MANFAMEVCSGRYYQSVDACKYLGEELKRLQVKKAYILGGKRALAQVLPKIEKSMREEGIDFETGLFEGYCTYENARKHVERLQQKACDFIVGVGGGKSMDTAKAVSQLSGLCFGTIPTQIATCVACTNMAVMYEESGAYIGPLFPEHPIAFTLVDLTVLSEAPIRYIASGIADSLAKYPELHFSQRNTHNCTSIDDATLQAAYGLSRSTWDVLMENGRIAYEDNSFKRVTHALSAVAHTNLISTGVISGLARGSKQLAIAHAVYNHSTTVFPETWRNFMHGEIVSVGIVLQQLYNGAPEAEVMQYTSIAKDLHVPVTLHEIGISGTDENQDALHRALLSQFVELTDAEKRKLRECIERIV